MNDKVIALIDMDCFYVQVEAREKPSLKGVPAAVVQYKKWKGGGIIAVNYEARAKGVTRQMRGDDAREKCPDIVLVHVPENREKADLTKYRRAGREVIEVLLASGAVVERASIDEAYLDLTKLVEARLRKEAKVDGSQVANTHLGGGKGEERGQMMQEWLEEIQEEGGNPGDIRLALGAAIVEEIRAEVFAKTSFRCSAGISHCKTLAKLCAGQNKPNGQTVLPQSCVDQLYSSLSVTKVRGLGGKLGEALVEKLQISTMQELANLPTAALAAATDPKTAAWLALLCQGQDGEEVKERELPKSIGCGKNFRGPDILDTEEKVRLRLSNLVEELVERIEVDKEEYGRVARGLAIGVGLEKQGHVSRAGTLRSYSFSAVFQEAWMLLSRLNSSTNPASWTPKIVNLSIGASKFEDLPSSSSSTITAFFSKAEEPQQGRSPISVSKPSLSEAAENFSETLPHDPVEFGETSKTDVPTHNQNESKTGHQNQENEKVEEFTGSFFAGVIARREKAALEKKQLLQSEAQMSTATVARCVSVADIPNCDSNNLKGREVFLAGDKNKEESEVVSVEELIPSLEHYDPSLLDLLPSKLRLKARERVKQLEESSSKGNISRYLVKQPSKAPSVQISCAPPSTVCDNQSDSLNSEPVIFEEETPENGEGVEMTKCDQCGKLVSPFELPEHLDFHFAASLEASERRNPILSSNSGLKSQPRPKAAGKAGVKRKRGSEGGNISAFFTRRS